MAGESVEDEKVQDEEVLEADDKEEEEADEEVPVRKGNADYARTRIALKGAKKDAKESDDEELTEKAQKLIEEEVKKRLAPLTSDLENKMILRDYLADHPEHKKFESRAQKYMVAHPTLTVGDIFKILAPGVDPAERAKAEEKAARGSIKGTTVRKGEEKTASTEADFKQVYKNVKSGNTKEALKQLGIS